MSLLNFFSSNTIYDENQEEGAMEFEYNQPEEVYSERDGYNYGRQSVNVQDLRGYGSELPVSGAQQVVIWRPTNVNDGFEGIRHLHAGHTLACSLEKADEVESQRILDFMVGAAAAVNGMLTMVHPLLYMIVPHGVAVVSIDEVASAHEEEAQYTGRG